jgi:hypothetical protein
VTCGATADQMARRCQHARRRWRAGIRPVPDAGGTTPRRVHALPTAWNDGTNPTRRAPQPGAEQRCGHAGCEPDAPGASLGTLPDGKLVVRRRRERVCRGHPHERRPIRDGGDAGGGGVPVDADGGRNRKRHGHAARPHAIPFHPGQGIDLRRLVAPGGAGIRHGGGRARATSDRPDRVRTIGTDVRVASTLADGDWCEGGTWYQRGMCCWCSSMQQHPGS